MKNLTIFFLLLLYTLLCTISHSWIGYCCIFCLLCFLIGYPDIKTSQKKYLFIFMMYIAGYVAITKIIFYQDTTVLGCGQNGQMMDRGVSLSGTIDLLASKPTLMTPHGKLLLSNIYIPSDYESGQTVTVSGKLSCLPLYPEPFSYDIQSYMKGYRGTVIVSSINLSNIDSKLSSQSMISNSSDAFPAIKMSSPYGGIAEGILYGVTDRIDRNIYKQFITSGLVYLLSASGGNISLFCTILIVVFRGVSIPKRKYIVLAFIGFYAYLLRTNIALMRAFISFVFAFSLIPYGVRLSRVHLFSIILLICVIYNPYLLVSSRGLVLSCAGVWGLIHIPIQLKKNTIINNIATPIWTFFALLGPLLFLTKSTNVFTIILSLPASLLAALISGTSLFFVVFPFLQHTWILQILFYMIKSLCWIANLGSNHGLFITTSSESTIYIVVMWACIWSLQRYTMLLANRHYYATKRD